MALVSYDATVGDVNKFKTVEYWEGRKIFREVELSDFLPHEKQVVNTIFTRGKIEEKQTLMEKMWKPIKEFLGDYEYVVEKDNNGNFRKKFLKNN